MATTVNRTLQLPEIAELRSRLSPEYRVYAGAVEEQDLTDQLLHQRLGRFGGFSKPRDVTISTDFARSQTTLYVSDFAANQRGPSIQIRVPPPRARPRKTRPT